MTRGERRRRNERMIRRGLRQAVHGGVSDAEGRSDRRWCEFAFWRPVGSLRKQKPFDCGVPGCPLCKGEKVSGEPNPADVRRMFDEEEE